jgi:hypothetical protein
MRLIILLTVIFSITSTWDLTDEIQFSEEYKTMVCSGAWPDYKSLHPEC